MRTLSEYLKESEIKSDEYVYAVKDDTGAIMCIGATKEEAKDMADDFESKEDVKTTIEKIKKTEIET